MSWLISLFDWLTQAAGLSLGILLVGSLAVLISRQPARRIRIIELTLLGCLAAPCLCLLPGLPQWSTPGHSVLDWNNDVSTDSPTAESPAQASGSLSHKRPVNAEPVISSDQSADFTGDNPGIAGSEGSADPTNLADESTVRPARPSVTAVELSSAAKGGTQRSSSAMDRLWFWCVTGYLVGVGAMAVWWLIGLIRLVRVLRRAQPAGESCRSVLSEIGGSASDRVRLLKTEHISQPFTVGFCRPVIVLPNAFTPHPSPPKRWRAAGVNRPVPPGGSRPPLADSSWRGAAGEGGDSSELRWCLAHEWAHIENGHLRTWLLAGLARVVFWYQPLVWWLRARLRLEQDYLADARAAGQSPDPADYAEFLTSQVASRVHGPAAVGLGIGARPSPLYRRVTMLVQNDKPLEKRPPRWWTVCVVIGAALLVGVLSTFRGDTATVAADDGNAGTSPEASTNTPPAQSNETEAESDSITVFGTCEDGEGKPIRGAEVRLYLADLRNRSHRLVETVQTNSEGRFRLTDVPSLGQAGAEWRKRYYVVATAKGRASAVKSFADDEESRDVQISMPRAGTLSGQVTTVDGQPVSDAEVWLLTVGSEPLEGIRSAKTDEKGHFEIDDVRPWNADDTEKHDPKTGVTTRTTACFFRIRHPEYGKTLAAYTKAPDTVNVVLERPAVVEGRVVYGETGKPADNVVVSAQATTQGRRNLTETQPAFVQAKTDGQGHYRLLLHKSTYNIWAAKEGWTAQALDSFEATAPKTYRAPDLHLVKGGFVEGRLINAATGQPVHISKEKRLSVGLYGPSRPRSGAAIESALIEADGSFRIRVAPGRNYLYLTNPRPWEVIEPKHHWVEVSEGQTVEIEFRVLPNDLPQSGKRAYHTHRAQLEAEKPAIAAIRELGGWVAKGPDGHVVEVNMVYHYTEDGQRLENENMTDEALFYVRKFPKLKRLLLKRSQATDQGLKYVGELKKLENLFMWDAHEVTDAGIAHLKSLKNLTYLHCSNSGITDQALEHLRNLKQLEGLSLQGNRFTDEALKHMSALTNLKSLVVGLGNTNITDDGLRHLKGLDKLEKLGLQRTQITDAGLKHLKALPRLKQLWLSETEVTDAGVQELKKALPDLEVPR